MAIRKEFKIIDPANETPKVECRECLRSTKHRVLAEVKESYEEDIGQNYTFYATGRFQTVACNGCETVSFRRLVETSEDDPVFVGPGEDDWGFFPEESIYPTPNNGRAPLSDAHLLPTPIHRIYEETLAALNSNQPVLCGIGLRAIIETVVKDQKAPGDGLASQINGLVSQGGLTKDGATILHKLRTMGNNAAHEVKPHNIRQLGLAMDVIEHLLEGVYVLPKHASATFE